MKMKFGNIKIKFPRKDKLKSGKKGIPDTLPANGHDICNYAARYGMANFQIQLILKLDGRLDFDKLRKAVRLSMDAEPVFGCRFIESDPPYWKRLDDIGNTTFCTLEETDNPDEAVRRFLESPLDMDNEPKVKVKLIRSGPHDTLGVKVNHACCDGAGAKEYTLLLSDIYSRIVQENGTFIPKPHIGGRKDQDRLLHTLGIKFPELEWNFPLETSQTMWTFPWYRSRKDDIHFAVCNLPQGHLDLMSRYGKSKGATINDLILTAFYRAMFKISQPPYGVPMDISSTIDLRRYLPDQKAVAIRNFSGVFFTRIARKKGESFEGTLSRVAHATNTKKKGFPGLPNVLAGERVEKMPFSQFLAHAKNTEKTSTVASLFPVLFGNICSPGLSNVGFISKSPIKFGEHVATDAYMIPPVVRAPGFLLMTGTYNGVLTLAIGFYKGEVRRKYVEKLLHKIKAELMEGCV